MKLWKGATLVALGVAAGVLAFGLGRQGGEAEASAKAIGCLTVGNGLKPPGQQCADFTLSAKYAGSGGSFGTANSLARSDHNHDAAYVNVTGDAMTGPLTATRLAAGGCPTALDGDACAAGNLDVAGGLTAAAATVTGNVQVDGDIGLDGAVVQQRTVGGTVKAAVLVTCSTTPSILQSFVNVRGVGGTITATTGGSTGRCKLNFPFQVDDRYIVATPAGTNGAVGVTWNTLVEDSDTISFSRFATTSGSGVNGAISVLVY